MSHANPELDPAGGLARPLAVARVDVHPVSIPLRHPMRMAGVVISHAENVLVRVETVDGSFGWGEAASAPTMTGEILWGMVGAARLLADAIVGQDLRCRAAVLDRMHRAIHANQSARSAIEMAILDLVARRLGVPFVELLGGRRRDTILPMWLIGHPTPEADVAEARAKHTEGFAFFKLKIGTKTLEGDIAAALAVRQALGPTATLCVDANGGLTAAAATTFLRETHGAALAFVEQPVAAERLDDMAMLEALAIAPIGADEGIHSIADIDTHAARRAARGVSLKMIKLGGPAATAAAANRAAALGLHINIAAKVAETSIGAAAAAHLACASPNIDWGISLTQVYLQHDPVTQPMVVHDGRISPPPGPGLGVEVDEAALKSYRAPSP